MNYLRPELLDALAGPYVLGTLRGRARGRFARLCEHSAAARAAVQRWEDHFMPLLPALVPIAPSLQVWRQISRRIQNQTSPEASQPTRWRATGWRWALAGGLALSLMIGVSIRWLNPPLEAVATLGQDVTHPLWSVSRTLKTTALTLSALHPVQSDPQRAYELWALPRDGKPPVSLGLMPRTGSIERALSEPQRAALLSANKLAVSLEPVGGSPTGAPTGPVLYVAEVTIAG